MGLVGLVLGVVVALLSSCGIDRSTETIDHVFASRFGDPPQLPSPASPGTSPVTLPDGSTGISTTTGGYVTIKKKGSVTLAGQNLYNPAQGQEQFRGMSSDSQYIYLLVKKNYGGGIMRWEFRASNSLSLNFSDVCSVLDDGAMEGFSFPGTGFAVDSSYFYVYRPLRGSNSVIRRFSKTDCQEVALVNLGRSTWSYDYRTHGSMFGMLSGVFYFVKERNLGSFFGGDQSYSEAAFGQKIGTRTLDLGSSYAGINSLTTVGNTIWIIENGFGSNNPYLWKLTTSNAALGWVMISAYSEDQLSDGYFLVNHTRHIAMKDENTLLISTYDVNGYGYGTNQLRVFEVDVSRF